MFLIPELIKTRWKDSFHVVLLVQAGAAVLCCQVESWDHVRVMSQTAGVWKQTTSRWISPCPWLTEPSPSQSGAPPGGSSAMPGGVGVCVWPSGTYFFCSTRINCNYTSSTVVGSVGLLLSFVLSSDMKCNKQTLIRQLGHLLTGMKRKAETDEDHATRESRPKVQTRKYDVCSARLHWDCRGRRGRPECLLCLEMLPVHKMKTNKWRGLLKTPPITLINCWSFFRENVPNIVNNHPMIYITWYI